MANRFPGQTSNVRPPTENVIPSIMGGVNLPPPMGMQPPMFRQMHPSGWATPHLQQPTLAGQSGFAPVATNILAPQQVPSQPQGAGGKDRNYLQQQQKLRAMSSSFKRPGPLSADSLIEDLLQQKDTFTVRPQQPLPTPEIKASPVQVAIVKPHSSLESQGISDLSSTELHAGAVPNSNLVGAVVPTSQPLWLSPDAYDLLPAVYRKIWELTKIPASDGRELVDTGRIFNILLTSGLPRDALGYIWNLANTVIPGVLTRPELNVALALVALAQSGWRNFTSSAVLSMVQQPPVPNLQLETVPIPPSSAVNQTLMQPQTNLNPMLQPQIPQTMSQNFQETSVPISLPQSDLFSVSSENKPPENFNILPSTVVEPKNTPISQGNILDDNDDFTDFQSAAPTSVPAPQPTSVPAPQPTAVPQMAQLAQPDNSKTTFFSPRDSPLGFNSFESPPASPVHTKPAKGSREVGSRLANYSFGAPGGNPSSTKRNSTEIKEDLSLLAPAKVEDSMFPKCNIKPPPQLSEKSISLPVSMTKSSDENIKHQVTALQAPGEDKYSALRDLCFDSSSEEKKASSVPDITPAAPSVDDFGDFLSASSTIDDSFAELATREKAPNSILPAPSIEFPSSEPAPQEWNANFEDFANSSSTAWGEEPTMSTLPVIESTTSQTEEDEEDFGDFVGPSTISSLPPLNRLRETSTVTPDTQSVASLELGGFDNLSLGGAGAGSSPDGGLSELRAGLESVQWEAASAALQEEGREWKQCLHSCLALLQAAAQILGAIDDPHVVEEVVTSREGEDYLANLLEVYCVTQRISAASHQLLPASRHSLEPLLAEVESAWHILSPFLERSNIEVQKDRKWNVPAGHSSPFCAICLVMVEETEGSTALVRSGQHCYHAACANLWLNCVDGLLPTMTVP